MSHRARTRRAVVCYCSIFFPLHSLLLPLSLSPPLRSHSLFPVSTDTQAGIAGNELELFFFSRYAVWRFVFKNSGQQTFFLIGVAVKCKCCGRQFCNRQFLLRLVLSDRRLRLRFGLKLAVRAVFYIWFWQQKFRRFGGVGWRVARPFGCLDNNLNLLSE